MTPHLTPDALKTKFAAAGYAHLAELLIENSRRGIAILRTPADDDSVPTGASKLGGWPDLPAGTPWPQKDGRALAFLGQVALAEVHAHVGESPLPARGLLSVFYDAAEQPWGFDPKDRGGALMLYWPEPAGLTRMKPPVGAYSQSKEHDEPFKPCAIEYEAVTTYTSVESELAEEDDWSEVYDLMQETVRAGQGQDESPRHQLLGHPLVVQNPMEEECQLVTNGLYCGGELSPSDEKRAEELQAGAQDWTLLLQIDSDDTAGWMWGDMGMLYFWIRRQDLATADFSKAWCILQCG